jgi:general secretion pathway protein B
MSYILNALKKSEQERKKGRIPTLESVHNDPVSIHLRNSARRRKMSILLLFACLVVIAVGLWQWRIHSIISRLNDQPAVENQTGSGAESQSQPASQLDGQGIASQIKEPVQKIAPRILNPVQKDLPSTPKQLPETTAAQQEVVIEPLPLDRPERPSLPPIHKESRAPDSNLPLLKELPPEQQNTIPKIIMAGHVYADEPSRRMIMINNKVFREGELVGDQLKLIRITWDGVILRHVDTEFQIKLK